MCAVSLQLVFEPSAAKGSSTYLGAMLGANSDSVDVLAVQTHFADKVAGTWCANPLWIHVEALDDETVDDLLRDIQHVRSTTQGWLRILVQETMRM